MLAGEGFYPFPSPAFLRFPMALHVIQTATSKVNRATSVTLTWGSQPEENSLLYIGLGSDGGLILTPSGWTALTSVSTSSNKISAFYKTAGASESTTVTINTFLSAQDLGAGGVEYKDYAGSFHQQVTNTGTSTTTHDSSSIASLTGNRSILCHSACVNKTVTYSGLPSDATERIRLPFGGGLGQTLFVLDRDDENPSGSTTMTATSSASSDFANNYAEFDGQHSLQHILKASRQTGRIGSQMAVFQESEDAVLNLWR